ncbi:restriction endonuclease subunit S [Clostridium botulinum]|uniref:Restriction endonuclease subunit S n=1 Tax=Clostridium botulinum TaxID=1491 RepID=A0ABD7CLY2_CLOBO|nr:restriction endonuclease subunit S [Clostridium botulinum]KGO13663.1 hypothetical protein NZ45_11585 [Clostridium botulinum]KIN80387.1 hypothetical protein SD74_15685 [Clostridium botulinum]MCC5426050.1 restriction endonuclease subunit S [Clostridium botulinum]QRI54278.1 restriction endonuclease subunit S [Clostridium botulinum]
MKSYKLKDITNLITCGVAKRPEYVDDGVMFLSSQNVKADRIILDKYNCISEEGYVKLTKINKPLKGDILYTRVGSFGEAAVVDFDDEFAVYVSLTLIKPKEDVINNRYLMHYLNSPKIKNFAQNNTRGIGVQNLNVDTVRDFDILVPSLEKQHKIVKILDRVQELIDKRKAQIEALDELVKSRFIDMFGEPVLNTKNWEIKSVIDVCDCMVPGRDKPKSFTGSTPWITIDDLNVNGVTYKSKSNLGLTDNEINEVKRKKVPKGSVLMSCVGNLGICSIAGEKMIINQQLHSFQCKDINNFFLMYYLGFRKDYMMSQANSTTVLYMNKTVCNSIPVYIPPIELQNQFADFVKQIDKLKFEMEKSLKELEDNFNSLMQKSFNGELFN